MSSLFKRVGVAALAGALVFAPAASTGAAVKITTIVGDNGWEFDPPKKRVVKGTVVKWVEKSYTAHRIEFYKGPFSDGSKDFRLDPEEVVKRRLRKTGVYKFRCTISPHSSLADGVCTGMCGVIRVTKS